VSQNYAQAEAWYRKAAEQGNARAQLNLGMLYNNGQGVPQDYAQAAQWYRKAAVQGDFLSQSNLGVLYVNGHGVHQDFVLAAQWFRKAADQGYALAQNNLGVLYDNGLGVPQDYAQAVQWYRTAADQGFANAQNNLGVMYAKSRGVPQDYVIAYALYNLAASKDHSNSNSATSNRDAIVSLMSRVQIEAGRALTQQMGLMKATVAIAKYEHNSVTTEHARTMPHERTQIVRQQATTSSGGWPAKPAHRPGVTSCNTQCMNGDCLRTYDDGRHVHLHVSPSIDPFTNEMKFETPPC
jgi:TPR repeat protein